VIPRAGIDLAYSIIYFKPTQDPKSKKERKKKVCILREKFRNLTKEELCFPDNNIIIKSLID